MLAVWVIGEINNCSSNHWFCSQMLVDIRNSILNIFLYDLWRLFHWSSAVHCIFLFMVMCEFSNWLASPIYEIYYCQSIKRRKRENTWNLQNKCLSLRFSINCQTILCRCRRSWHYMWCTTRPRRVMWRVILSTYSIFCYRCSKMLALT